MSIRKGKTVIAGNSSSIDWVGTLQEYNVALKNGTIKKNWICYITDDNQNGLTYSYGSDVALLDIIVSNQLLEGADLVGKALQGSMVLGSEYPDAYNKLLTNKNRYTSKQITETIGGIEVTYIQCVVGYKILDISNKDKYDALFEATGTANFFVLDEGSKLFYLPKTNNFLQPNLNGLGNYNEAGLPDIQFYGSSFDNTYGYTNGQTLTSQGVVKASNQNDIYGNSNTVQPASTNVYIYYKIGNTIQLDANIDLEAQVLNLQQRNNIPFTLLESKYSEIPLYNTSWLLSNGSWYDGIIYEAVYDKLVSLQEKPQDGFSVKLNTEEYDDYDFVLNLDDETFRLPLKTKYKFYKQESVSPVAGNGKSLGLTDGSHYVGIGESDEIGRVYVDSAFYNTQVGTRSGSGGYVTTNNVSLGVVTDATKSGIEAHVSLEEVEDLYLYYYVGDTNKDLNVINTGKLAEKYSRDIDNKLDKSQITNCLLEVPQRIKLELADGVLTLKAGSEVIEPNGVDVFEYIPIANDLSMSVTSGTNSNNVIVYYYNNSLRYTTVGKSGATEDTSDGLFYNTTENRVRRYATGLAHDGTSLPIAILTMTNGVFTSINQVFNGFGYIGSTVWVDKGVKGLAPIGRNLDGSLKNDVWEFNKVMTRTFTSNNANALLALNPNEPTVGFKIARITTDEFNYYEKENINSNGTAIWSYTPVATFTETNGVISNFQPKLPFRAMDANTPHITETYQNGTSWYRVYSDGWCEQGGVTSTASVTFLKSFANTNYSVTCTYYQADASVSKSGHFFPVSKTKTTMSRAYDTTTVNWTACGYIA